SPRLSLGAGCGHWRSRHHHAGDLRQRPVLSELRLSAAWRGGPVGELLPDRQGDRGCPGLGRHPLPYRRRTRHAAWSPSCRVRLEDPPPAKGPLIRGDEMRGEVSCPSVGVARHLKRGGYSDWIAGSGKAEKVDGGYRPRIIEVHISTRIAFTVS